MVLRRLRGVARAPPPLAVVAGSVVTLLTLPVSAVKAQAAN
jgi:hypothetical protein